MTAYGVLITILLIAPWVLVGVIFMGGALERLKRRPAIGYLLRWAREAGRSVWRGRRGDAPPTPSFHSTGGAGAH